MKASEELGALAEETNEAFGLTRAPVGRLGVDRAFGAEDVLAVDLDREHRAAFGLEDDVARDEALRAAEVCFEVFFELCFINFLRVFFFFSISGV